MSLYTLNEKTQSRGLFYIISNAWKYLNDEKKICRPTASFKEGWTVLTGTIVINRRNFQQMLDLGFSETSQNLSSFKQLLFSSFHRGYQRKKLKKTGEFHLLCISVFPITHPLFWIASFIILFNICKKYFWYHLCTVRYHLRIF